GVEGCTKCIKYLLFVFNFVFWLAGGVILGVALWLRHDPQTTNLLYLELGDKPAPNTFYVGECTCGCRRIQGGLPGGGMCQENGKGCLSRGSCGDTPCTQLGATSPASDNHSIPGLERGCPQHIPRTPVQGQEGAAPLLQDLGPVGVRQVFLEGVTLQAPNDQALWLEQLPLLGRHPALCGRRGAEGAPSSPVAGGGWADPWFVGALWAPPGSPLLGGSPGLSGGGSIGAEHKANLPFPAPLGQLRVQSPCSLGSGLEATLPRESLGKVRPLGAGWGGGKVGEVPPVHVTAPLPQIAKDVKQFYDQALQQAVVDDDANNAKAVVKTFHETLDCCGSSTLTGLTTSVLKNNLCPSGSNIISNLLKKDCHQKIDDLFSGKLYLIGIAAIVVAVIMIFEMILSMVLCCGIRNSSVY
ncbi:PREDICTED: CD81 antigen, partial [Rhinopithecus bieti]|uniref:CD81 antigen n=1 Tax=Rhinopithecus bieti TaxID=61621 RepID=UPI00083C14AD